MPVPDFQSLFVPLLKVARDGDEHSITEAIETVAQQLGLSEQDRNELLPSGKQRKFDNRVGWVRTYLQKSQLLSFSAVQEGHDFASPTEGARSYKRTIALSLPSS